MASHTSTRMEMEIFPRYNPNKQCVLFVLFQVKYTGYRDRPLQERQAKFQAECQDGHADIVSVKA